jgi:uncharacterized membrane protein YgcG
MWVWILLGLAILVILFYRPRENMTNDQLISTLKQFGNTSSSGTSENPIYGPSANPPPVPTNRGAGGGKTVAGPYPQIFGPDVTNAPGTSRSSGSVLGGSDLSGGDLSGGDLSGGGSSGGGGGGGNGGGGGVQRNGYVFSDQPGPQGKTHQFNPDLAKAFPVDGPPQPFLTDFSKIQH